MNDNQLNPAQSLDLIQTMINTAKNRLADDGFYIIFWGWLVFISAGINYISWLLNMPEGSLVWAVLMPLGAIYSVIAAKRRDRNELVKTHVETYLGYVWGAFIIALTLTLALMPVHSMKTTYFFLMVLYGMATFTSGGLLSFKPLIIGSLFSFAAAIVSTFVSERDQLLCIAIAILCSYIIPGHLLRAKYRSQADV